jgi:broad specificity phosphatase PhoE
MVRHGETDWNRAEKVQGWTDVPLNETGRMQAKRLSEQLTGIPFLAIFSSDLQRARTTAMTLQAGVGAPLYIDKRLRERSFGAAEGMNRHEVRARFENGVPDEEPLTSLQSRAAAFLADMGQQYAAGRILCVTHGGFIRTLLHLTGVADIPPILNTSVTRLHFDGVSWMVPVISAAAHLESPASTAGSDANAGGSGAPA